MSPVENPSGRKTVEIIARDVASAAYHRSAADLRRSILPRESADLTAAAEGEAARRTAAQRIAFVRKSSSPSRCPTFALTLSDAVGQFGARRKNGGAVSTPWKEHDISVRGTHGRRVDTSRQR